jgi:hypothetical protein
MAGLVVTTIIDKNFSCQPNSSKRKSVLENN